ncbi:MAG: Txe/YoeB family addiction module toxin [Streptosporangiaceae bacterium]
MSESRANYAATLDSVINDQEEVVITRPGGENVVMLPQREYESMRETLYLMSSPANRPRSENTGIGKPEPLRHEWAGWWSRRITQEHRLVYCVSDGGVEVAVCRFHHGK